MLRKFIFLVALFISAGQLWAANGTIRLTIFDQETGEALIGATAVIKGTTQGGVADLDGKATINNVTAGSYAIEVAYVSYQTKVIENVNVGEGETVVMEVGLSTETVGLEEIVVTADAIKSSDAALLTLQKKSPGLFDAVSSENFTKLGDSDAGAAVKRVVGVTVEGGKYVYVRGLGDRYSKSSLNSATIPSADPNKNAVQLDMFPSNLIDNIIVYKTFTPDLPGDFSGGYVDITTKDFPDRFTVQVQASAGYNTQATFNEDFMTYPGGSKDWLGKDDGTRALPDILAGLTQQEFNNAVLNNDAAKDLFTKSFNNHNFDFTRSSQPVNHSFSLSVGNQFNVFNKQLGFVAGLTYDRDFNYYEDGEIGRWLNTSGTVPTLDGDKNRQLTEQKSTENVSIGALLNTTLKLNNNNKVAVNLLYNQNGDKMTSWQYGPYGGDASINFDQNPQLYWDSRSLFFEERAIKNGMLRGEHVIPSLNNFKIKWFTSNTNSTLDQPDFRLIVSTNQVNEESGEILSQRINTARFRPGRYFRSMDEFITDNHLDFELPVTVFSSKESKIKFGGAYLSKDREFRERRYEYLDGNANNVFEGSVNNLFSPDILGLTPDGLGRNISDFSQQINNYNADQQVVSGYLMIDLAVTDNLNIITGARYESTEQNIQSFDEDKKGSISEQDILPSLGFKYALAENSNLRLSYGRTLARPSFREFAPFTTFAFPGDRTLVGNPGLKRSLIDNLDIRFETFPKAGEYFGISGFYKKFNQPIEMVQNVEAGGSGNEFTFVNVDEGFAYGVEIELKKDLYFISPAFEPFKIGANVTLMNSKVSMSEQERSRLELNGFQVDDSGKRAMFNQSPFVVNAYLMYEGRNNGISSTLGFNIFGKRLYVFQTAQPSIYEMPRPDLNFSLKKSFAEKYSLTFRANNLLNPDYAYQMDFKGVNYVDTKYTMGREFSISFTFLID